MHIPRLLPAHLFTYLLTPLLAPLLTLLLALLLALPGADALAQGQTQTPAPRPASSLRTEAQVQSELLQQLERDGFLSHKMAAEARAKYLDPRSAPKAVAPGALADAGAARESAWSRYLSWLNFFKVLAVILVLLAFAGTVKKIGKGALFLINKLPVLVYQLALLALSLFATCMPQALWQSQASYVVLLAAFANLILAGWILGTHRRFADRLLGFSERLAPIASVVSGLGMLYFGALAVHYQSQVFGFLTAVNLSGLLSFGLYYSPGRLVLHFDRHSLYAVIFGHLALLLLYVLATATGMLPPWAVVFGPGIEYYCTIALCVGLLCGASPWSWKGEWKIWLAGLFVVVFTAAMAAYFLLELHVVGSIVTCFFILFVLEWLGKLGYSYGMVIGSAVLGASLYALAMLLEKHGSFLILSVT